MAASRLPGVEDAQMISVASPHPSCRKDCSRHLARLYGLKAPTTLRPEPWLRDKLDSDQFSLVLSCLSAQKMGLWIHSVVFGCSEKEGKKWSIGLSGTHGKWFVNFLFFFAMVFWLVVELSALS